MLMVEARSVAAYGLGRDGAVIGTGRRLAELRTHVSPQEEKFGANGGFVEAKAWRAGCRPHADCMAGTGGVRWRRAEFKGHAMQLQGSCHCGRVTFSVESAQPVPFMRCYCSICRKTAGTGGYAINLGADYRTLEVRGKRYLRVYRALLREGDQVRESTAQRHFCGHCGTALWLYDPTWPELVHPHAGAIDTPLPLPPERVHLMLGSRANWAEPEGHPGDPRYDGYPDMSLAEWHEQRGWPSPPG
jgi:hypothetical protein